MEVGDLYRNERMDGVFVVDWRNGDWVTLSGQGWIWQGRIEDMRQAGFYRPQDGPQRPCNREA